MDASDDRDLKLQRKSADLISDFESSITPFIWKGPERTNDPCQLRLSVKRRETSRLVGLLEPFQEWPQLLDPHLAKLFPPLVSAFVDALTSDKHDLLFAKKTTSSLSTSIPLRRALCKLLYTFCKIRGEKVVSSFLNNEPKYLEPMLSTFESLRTSVTDLEEDVDDDGGYMTWEERYVMLLWLSHLILTPFDLNSLSSEGVEEMCVDQDGQDQNPGFDLPQDLPSIAVRLISLSLHYLVAPSKERQSARAVLVRLALRPDMRRLGLMDGLVLWSLSTLERPWSTVKDSIYSHVGVLSFLAGVLGSASHSAIAPYILPIFRTVQTIIVDDASFYQSIRSSALTRKLLIKISRSLAIITLQASSSEVTVQTKHAASTILDDVIDYLLSSLADKDTPVRYAASKALSMVTLKLEEDMAAEVVEAVVGSMTEDVLWDDETPGPPMDHFGNDLKQSTQPRRNLTAVNALRWHGLVLTLAQLLFRRSPPPRQLPDILNSLLLALEFEQRSSTGTSLGTNVRDAACFGIWALSRRYTPTELLAVEVRTIPAANRHGGSISVPQLLAVELTVAASFDPAGNIRRGASAALQELIGRHPDVIEAGIPLVQTVDYHAVALRTRAMTEVAPNASRLGKVYWHALTDAILEWRGIGSADAASRRAAATGLGLLSVVTYEDESPSGVMKDLIVKVSQTYRSTQPRQVEERHGLLLSLSAVLDEREKSYSPNPTDLGSDQDNNRLDAQILHLVNQTIGLVSEQHLLYSVLRPELTAEAVCQLISSTSVIIGHQTGAEGVGSMQSHELVNGFIAKSIQLLTLSLSRPEDSILNASSMTARRLFAVMTPSQRTELIDYWITKVTMNNTGRLGAAGRGFGYVNALGTIFSGLETSTDPRDGLSSQQHSIVNALVACSQVDVDIESRVVAVRNLATGVIQSGIMTDEMVSTLANCLDDYTIDSRGDVGSWVRVEAIDAVLAASRRHLLVERSTESLLSRVARLAAEKFDKARLRAWQCLSEVLRGERLLNESLQVSSYQYFKQLLSLLIGDYDWMRMPLLEGFVTSAGVGSESVLKASRMALADFAEHLGAHYAGLPFTLLDLCNLLLELLRRSLDRDRVLVPMLEVFAFFFDVGIMRHLEATDFKWRNLLIQVQRAHFKSGNVQKLEAAVKVYAGLANVAPVRPLVLAKLIKMLSHPFPAVRNGVADVLYSTMAGLSLEESFYQALKREDWSVSPKDLKATIQFLEGYLPATADTVGAC